MMNRETIEGVAHRHPGSLFLIRRRVNDTEDTKGKGVLLLQLNVGLGMIWRQTNQVLQF